LDLGKVDMIISKVEVEHMTPRISIMYPVKKPCPIFYTVIIDTRRGEAHLSSFEMRTRKYILAPS
jgi:hypothetical protein